LNVEVVNHATTFKIVIVKGHIFVFDRPTRDPCSVELGIPFSFLVKSLILLSCGAFLLSFLNNFALALGDQIVKEIFESKQLIEDLEVLVDRGLNCATLVRVGSQFCLCIILLLLQRF
jgi:hypothetical protein